MGVAVLHTFEQQSSCAEVDVEEEEEEEEEGEEEEEEDPPFCPSSDSHVNPLNPALQLQRPDTQTPRASPPQSAEDSQTFPSGRSGPPQGQLNPDGTEIPHVMALLPSAQSRGTR